MKMKSFSPPWSPTELFAGALIDQTLSFCIKGRKEISSTSWTGVNVPYALMGCGPVLSSRAR